MQELTVTNQTKFGAPHWLVVMTAGIGLFLSTLDTGIMNVAMPTLSTTLNVGVQTIAWTVTLYLLSLTTTIVVFGRLSDRVGRLKVYSWGLIVFAVASILCGGAFSVYQLILFRGLQGVGAAMLQATSAAIITTCMPPERRGPALGTLGMILGLGPVLGPSVGGLLLSFAGWRYIFWINVPICLAGLWGSLKLTRVTSEEHGQMPLNVLANVLLGLATFGIVYGLSTNHSHGIMKILSFCLCAFSLSGYMTVERRSTHPIVPLSLLRNFTFVVPILSVTVLGFATAITFIVPPFFLEQVSCLAPWQVGFVNLASPFGLVILSKISGKHISTFGAKQLMTAGSVVMLIALVLLSTVPSNLSPYALAGLLLLYGVGAGIFVPANLSAIMGSVGHSLQGTIGAIQRMVQNIGIAVGTSVTAAMIHSGASTAMAENTSSLRTAWTVAAVAVLASILTMRFMRSIR